MGRETKLARLSCTEKAVHATGLWVVVWVVLSKVEQAQRK
jgi:hypothetical protein